MVRNLLILQRKQNMLISAMTSAWKMKTVVSEPFLKTATNVGPSVQIREKSLLTQLLGQDKKSVMEHLLFMAFQYCICLILFYCLCSCMYKTTD